MTVELFSISETQYMDLKVNISITISMRSMEFGPATSSAIPHVLRLGSHQIQKITDMLSDRPALRPISSKYQSQLQFKNFTVNLPYVS